jgi:hypothetical protein
VHVDAAGANGIRHDVVDVGNRGEMDHRIAAADRAPRRLAVRHVAGDREIRPRRVMPRRHEVEHHRLVARGVERVEDVRADEARAAGDEDSHPETPASCAVPAGR